jgi:hypothetical protein
VEGLVEVCDRVSDEEMIGINNQFVNHLVLNTLEHGPTLVSYKLAGGAMCLRVLDDSRRHVPIVRQPQRFSCSEKASTILFPKF